jgi:hypothetical protein
MQFHTARIFLLSIAIGLVPHAASAATIALDAFALNDVNVGRYSNIDPQGIGAPVVAACVEPTEPDPINDVTTMTMNAMLVPEWAALLLVGTGLIGLSMRYRRRA